MTATYVYAIVKSDRAPKLGKAPRGLAKAEPPRSIEVKDGYYLVVATVPLATYDANAIDARLRDLEWVGARAAEHEAVVEHVAELGTTIPMKLFTIFATDERARQDVAKRKRALDTVVARIAGCEEWGLRILFDETRAAKAAAADARRNKPASGREFLLRKKSLDDARKSSGTRGAALVEDLYDRLSKIARRNVRRPPPAQVAARVLLDAVFLVPRPEVKKIKAAASEAAPRLVDEGFDVTLTGPWPAYSFI
jgi:hypothetical protein